MINYKHVVFDWDGTLADTYPVISGAYNAAFDALGIPRIPYEEIKRITGTLQNREMLGAVFGERKAEASEALYKYIEEHHMDVKALPGAKELLEFCRDKGLDIYLVTNKTRKFVDKEMAKLGFDVFFKKTAAAREYEQDKPHPATTHSIFDGKIPIAETILMIGDGDADVQTAKSYGNAKSVIYDPEGTYKGSTPDYMVKSLLDIKAILEKK